MIWIKPRPLLLGHRGARRAAPENSLKAFELALAQGCDGFEFDLRCTRDRRAVLCHDAEIFGREISRSEYQDLIECGKASAQSQSGCGRAQAPEDCELLPQLTDVLARFGKRAFLDIELKCAGMEKSVAAAIAAHKPRACVVSSFIPAVLETMRRIAPEIPLGYICDRARELPRWRKLPCEAVMVNHRLARPKLVREIHASGKKVFVWTVNDRARMRRFAAWGTDGIISDDTALLGRVFGAGD